ncbi:MAG: hypothetical protein PUB51_03825, partial [Oscillospiraceae bacterium]|nr:hypothetical protein [Oscillospiraceae bacterium]
MALFKKREPCAICGGKVSGLFPWKIEGQLICNECYGNVDLPAEAGSLTMEKFQEYRQFRGENQLLKGQFQTTEHISFGFFGADFVFDRDHRLFCLSPTLDRTIFTGSEIKSFVIKEDDHPLFAGSAQGFRRYTSEVPEKVRNLAPLINQYRVQVEMQRSLERLAEEQRRKNPDAPRTPTTSRPSIDLPEPFERFYVEITLEHPYWTSIRADKKGPTFSSSTPDTEDYMRDYRQSVAEMERLAVALKEVAFP